MLDCAQGVYRALFLGSSEVAATDMRGEGSSMSQVGQERSQEQSEATESGDERVQQFGAVFYVTVAISAVFVLAGVLFTDPFGSALATVVGYITDYLGWMYMLMTSFFLGFAIWLALSRYGKIRLGQPDDRPEFGRFAWFAMLFQAGMGIGLVFWAVSEPVTHYTDPPLGQAGDGGRRLSCLADRLFPLGVAPVGDLRCGRSCCRVLQLSQGYDESAD